MPRLNNKDHMKYKAKRLFFRGALKRTEYYLFEYIPNLDGG